MYRICVIKWLKIIGTALSLETAQVFDVDGLAIAEHHHQDGEPDGRLGRGHREDEEYEYLSRGVTEVMRERDEVEIDGQQHELDRHQQDDEVLAGEKNADDAQREQDRPEDQIMRQRYHRPPLIFSFIVRLSLFFPTAS